ncbi:nesprin-2-like [Anguilla anguilla]|uniref:nesprin-2-like n=1 Tax=Anguilla anguilla TaxID=7936 RepID=UPI0015B03B55|nr:nesprin-2-like [Anguilla anguilla]
MKSGSGTEDTPMEEGSIPLDIENIQMVLQVEQEQIQKRTFTNWINAQLSKRSSPSKVSDLFTDLRDGVLLLDLLEVLSGQCMKREKGRVGMFQGRSNIETALNFLKKKSIKLVNINIPDIIDGRPPIVLGLIWSIILHCHIEELASSLSFGSRQSSLESLGGPDSPGDSPIQQRDPPLHAHLRISARKALLLWVREQCDRAGCSLSIKDFKSSWRSGEAFLAVLRSLRPDLVDLSQASGRTNRQNLEEAFRTAERELQIPRLLEPKDVDISDPDEKSIMTYVAQFLQYSKGQPASEKENAQASANQKVREVTCWLRKAYQELQEGWTSAEAGSYVERYQAFQMCVVPFEEQRRYITPMLSMAQDPTRPSEDHRALREAWHILADTLQQCDRALDLGLPAPLDAVGRWLLQMESVLTEEGGGEQDHALAAQDVRDKRELLKTTLKDMDDHLQTLRTFCNEDVYGSTLVPVDKLDQLNRRFTSARVTAKYQGMILDYLEFRYAVLELLAQADIKLRSWGTAYNSQESVRVRLQDWHDTVDKNDLITHLESSLRKMKLVANNYTSKAALAADAQRVSRQVREAEEETALKIEAVAGARSAMEQALSAWDTYNEGLSSLLAWLEQEAPRTEVTAECLAEWSTRHAHLNEAGNYLMEVTEEGTGRKLAAQLQSLNKQWADFINRTRCAATSPPGAPQRPPTVQQLTQEATLLMAEPAEVSSRPLRTFRKKLQLMIKQLKEADALAASPDWSPENQQELRKVMQELHEVERASADLQKSASALEGRLAELEHWEIEAWEVCQLLKERERRGQQGHDTQTKALISRGLQLEAQVVAEEQDYGVAVEAVRSRWPVLHLNPSQMHKRVKSTLPQAQETVGMLSSLGARRHQGPAEFQPPPKLLILSDTQGAPLSQPQIIPQHQLKSTPEPQCQTTPQPQNQTTPRPKPRLQVCPPHQERVESQPRVQGYSYAEAVTHPRSKTSFRTRGQTQTQPQTLQAQDHSPTQIQPLIQPCTSMRTQDPAWPHAQASTRPNEQSPTQVQAHVRVHVSVQTLSHTQTQTYSQPVPSAQTDTQAAVLAFTGTPPQVDTEVPRDSPPQTLTEVHKGFPTRERAEVLRGPPPQSRTEVPRGPPPQAHTEVRKGPPPQAHTEVPRGPPPQAHTEVHKGPPPQAHTEVPRGPPPQAHTEVHKGHPPQVSTEAPRGPLPQAHTEVLKGPPPQADSTQ